MCLGLMAWAVSAMVQDPKFDDADTRALRKAQFLYQFAQSNDWPDDVKTGPFTIGVHENPAVVEALLEKYAMQPVGSQLLEVRAMEGDDVEGYVHMLYTEASGMALDRLVGGLDGEPVMVVTAVQEAMPPQAAVNFLFEGGRTKYELNLDNAERRGLLVGNRILSWAVER